MYIATDMFFAPKHFIVHTFYGERTCFCWDGDKLAIFPYMQDNVMSLQVLTAPARIRTILCYIGRIFVICMPQGIYKLSRHREFAVLSKSAIGMGTVFYEVLKPRNKYLYLDNKQKMTNKVLFQLSSKECDSTLLCICPLSADNVDQHFTKALTDGNTAVENFCVISDGVKLFALINETVRIIYSSIHSIRDIIPVPKDSKIAGLFLLTNGDPIVVMNSKDDVLVFDRISLSTSIQAICAGFSQSSEDTLWIVYSDKSKLHYAKKQLLIDNVQQTTVQDKSFLCLQTYNPRIILGLTEDKQLIEFSIDAVERTLLMENDTFINLHPNMLKGVSFIMDNIYKRTRELHSLNEELTIEEDKLKEINLYAHRHKVQLRPEITISRIANQFFLSANFYNILPKNSWGVLTVKFKGRHVFCTKKIGDQETVLDTHISEGLVANFSHLIIDLITLKDEGHPWCLIINYVTKRRLDKSKKKGTSVNDSNFINSRIAMVEGFIKDGNTDMKKLLEIKRNVRNRFGNV